MMNEPGDPYRLSPRNVFLWGAAVTAVLVALVFLYVPAAPQDTGKAQSFEGYDAAGLERNDSGYGDEGSDSSTAAEQSGPRTPEAVFATYCAQCHGTAGAGDAPLARMMTNKPTSLVEGPFRFERTQEAIAVMVRKGVGTMPGFEEEISQDEAMELATYVLGLEGSDSGE